MLYMVTFTIKIPQMLAYIPYMDPMGMNGGSFLWVKSYDLFRHLQTFWAWRHVGVMLACIFPGFSRGDICSL